jgi:SWI/SNF-related matrix-associated actin-dependent regulator 1 of chromatin subfamily A
MDAQEQFLKLQGTDIATMKRKLEALSASAFNDKKQAVLEWVSDFLESDRKLVLLCWHIVVADFLEAALGKQCVRLRDKDREGTIRRFVEDPKCRVFLGNIQAAGTGVDGLQAVCSDVAFVELCGSPSDMDQGSSRLHRLGQQGCVTVHFLLAPGTVDMARLATLGGRDQNMSTLIDGQDEDKDMDSLVAMLKRLDIAVDY